MTLGLVCDTCDALSPVDAPTCQLCGTPFGIARRAPAAASPTAVPCGICQQPVAVGQRFCGSCGQPVGAAAGASGKNRTLFFGAMQAARPKLILIKGEGMDGVTYVLSAVEHQVGRREGAILFPDDPLLSPRHANFIYRDGRLAVRDESSTNGVFVRMIKHKSVAPGTTFLVGEQLLRVDLGPSDGATPSDLEGTFYYGSPRPATRLVLTQLLAGGHAGISFHATGESATIGREGNDINFPDDPFISGHHARVTRVDQEDGPAFQIADLDSKNGTFLRVRGETLLFHGDYVFVGQQLLRVEVS